MLTQEQINALEVKFNDLRTIISASDEKDVQAYTDCLNAYVNECFTMVKAHAQDNVEEMDAEISKINDKLASFYTAEFENALPSEALLNCFRKIRRYMLWFFGHFHEEAALLRVTIIAVSYKHLTLPTILLV